MSQKDITTEEELSIDNVNLDELTESTDNLISATEEHVASEPEPSTSSPHWHDFVMKHFQPNELDESGNPFVHGLRRVAKLLLGPIVKSQSRVVQAPNFIDTEKSILRPATVEHTIEFLWCRIEPPMPSESAAYTVTFTEVADVYWGNTDLEFARYPSAVASTRAEGRALRKALGLHTVVSAEETTKVPIEEAAVDGMITPTQISFMDVLCARCKIDRDKFINMGQKKYMSIKDVPFGVAAKMCEHLSKLNNKQDSIPENIKVR